MKTNLILTFSFPLLFNSCSSLVTKEDCKKDIKGLGIEHGKKGLSKLTDEVRSTCGDRIDTELYERGFAMGWSSHCTPFNGFEMGRKGDTYKSFCPPEKEKLFREKFLIGKTVYEKKDQLSEIEDKIKDLKPSAEKDLASKDELNKLQDRFNLMEHEIQTLEQQGKSLIHTN
jgi:hypothetical protein